MFGFNELKESEKAQKIYEGVGGKENITNIDNCFTRLRLEIKNIDMVNRDKVLESGAKDLVIIGEESIQIILGQKAEKVTEELKKLLV